MVNNIFENLFVLELANNHWGSLERGEKIVKEFAKIVKNNNIKAAIKLQFRNVETFIHKDFKEIDSSNTSLLPNNIRYIQKTSKTKLTNEEIKELVKYIRNYDCIPMATPFDEASVDLCVELNLPIIKIASSDINDWTLINKIALTKKPVMISTGGANEKQIDDVIIFFTKRNIPIALNHCVSKYPTEDNEMELNQIDFLKNRYPGITIGLSSHEYTDWESSMYISYAKGARTWERHIDIPYDKENMEQTVVSKYCSQPHQIDTWFKAYHKSVIMCGDSDAFSRRIIDETEENYLIALYRGYYMKYNLKKGSKVTVNDVYAAIPYQKNIGHLSSRNFINYDCVLKRDIKKDEPLTLSDIE